MRSRLALGIALLAGLAGGSGAVAAAPPRIPPQAVVAIVDTGINPYHKVFRDKSPRAYRHPSTYLPGFPKSAKALKLTLDAKSYDDALTKDCERVWANVEPDQLYWVPGTRIVGAISFGDNGVINCDQENPAGGPVLDANGHGTMTASRAVSSEYGACRDCLVVAVQMPATAAVGGGAPELSAIRFAADNASWIDAQSNSWGPVFPAYEPTGTAGLFVANGPLVKAVEEVSQAHLAFWASGNGTAFRYGVLGHPTVLAPHFGPSAIIVGGHDSGHMTQWPGFSAHVVSDACSSWAARIRTTTGSGEDVGGGTSGATPYAAGGAVRVLLEARRVLGDLRTGVRTGDVVASGPAGKVAKGPLADGKLTLAEWREVVFKTATRRPVAQFEDGPACTGVQYGASPVLWKDVPDQVPEYVQIGYGAVDTPALKKAFDVLRGKADLPDRAATDQYFQADKAVRGATHVVFAGP